MHLKRRGVHHHSVKSYLDERAQMGELVESSVEAIGPVLQLWLRHVEHRPPHTWTHDDVETWINAPGLRPSYRKSRLTKLRPFLRWLLEHDYLHHDPSRRIGKIRVPKGTPRDLTVDQVGELLAACPDERARLIVLMMVHLGLRAGDVARVRVEDIDVRLRSLHVRGKGGGGECTHWDPIPDEAWEALVTWIRSRGLTSGGILRAQRRPDDVLTPGTVSKLVGTWIRAAGLKAFPYDGRSSHSLRHTCGQHMIENGAEPRQVQHALGHASLTTTEKWYLLKEPPGLREAMGGRTYAA